MFYFIFAFNWFFFCFISFLLCFVCHGHANLWLFVRRKFDLPCNHFFFLIEMHFIVNIGIGCFARVSSCPVHSFVFLRLKYPRTQRAKSFFIISIVIRFEKIKKNALFSSRTMPKCEKKMILFHIKLWLDRAHRFDDRIRWTHPILLMCNCTAGGTFYAALKTKWEENRTWEIKRLFSEIWNRYISATWTATHNARCTICMYFQFRQWIQVHARFTFLVMRKIVALHRQWNDANSFVAERFIFVSSHRTSWQTPSIKCLYWPVERQF